jgi:hypothetical protein
MRGGAHVAGNHFQIEGARASRKPVHARKLISATDSGQGQTALQALVERAPIRDRGVKSL